MHEKKLLSRDPPPPPSPPCSLVRCKPKKKSICSEQGVSTENEEPSFAHLLFSSFFSLPPSMGQRLLRGLGFVWLGWQRKRGCRRPVRFPAQRDPPAPLSPPSERTPLVNYTRRFELLSPQLTSIAYNLPAGKESSVVDPNGEDLVSALVVWITVPGMGLIVLVLRQVVKQKGKTARL